MRLEVIHEFVMLAETLNYTRTAERLHVTQSTLSKHMIDLEKETGLHLLNHSVSEPALTEVGNVFLQHFSLIDAEIAGSLKKCRDVQREANNSIKFHLAELSVVMQPIKKSVRDYPALADGVSICFVEIPDYENVYEGISSKTIDIGVDIILQQDNPAQHLRKLEEAGFYVQPLVTERLFVWLSKDHPLASYKRIGFDEVKDFPIITSSGNVYDSVQKALIEIFAREDSQPKFRKFFFEDRNYSYNYFFLTDFHDSLMFTTSKMVDDVRLSSRPDLTYRQMDDPRFEIIVCLAAEASNKQACEFIRYCKSLPWQS